jgi:hypothetical protein
MGGAQRRGDRSGRDTLLPKLIAGKLRVKDAERALTDTPV